jgi:PAS domain S-box-containing protein
MEHGHNLEPGQRQALVDFDLPGEAGAPGQSGAMTQPEIFYRAIVQTMADGYWLVDTQGQLLDVNEAYCRMSGYSRAELLQMTIPEIEASESAVDVAEHMQRILRQGSDRFETVHRSKDGRRLHIEISVTYLPVDGGRLISFCREISDRKQIESLLQARLQALRESEERFRLSLKNAPVTVAAQDRELRFLWAYNQRTVDPQLVVGKTDWDIFPPDTAESLVALKRQALDTEQEIRQQLWVGSAGQQMFIDLCLVPMRDSAGQVTGLGIATVDLTPQKLAEDLLRKSEEAFKGYFNSGAVGMGVSSPETGWMEVNDRLCQMLGYSRAELLQLTWTEMTHPDDLQSNLELFNELLADQRDTYEMEKRFIRKDGQVIHTMLSVACQRNPDRTVHHLLTSVVDITARVQAERAVETLSERLALAAQVAGMGVWDYDVDGHNLNLDKQMYAIYGLPPGSPVTRKIFLKAVHPDDWGKTREALDDVYRKKTGGQVEYRILRPDGQLRHIYAAASARLDEHGEVRRVIGINLDITGRKQVEEALRIQYEALQEAQARLLQSEKLASIGQLVAGVAHELNNPLTAVILYSELLQIRYSDPQIRGDLEKVVQEAQRAAKIVRGLLEFARQRAVELRPVALNRLLSDSLEIVAYELRTHNIQCDLRLDPELPLTMADPHQIQQVFLNLVQNAWQAISSVRSAGRLSITSQVGAAQFHSDAKGSKPVIRFIFEDDGPGMPETLLLRVFDPFFSTKLVGKGTGLGLAICHGIVAEHDGHIWAENRRHGGARFIVELPVVSPETADEARAPLAEASRLGDWASILIIDDEVPILETTARVLRRLGCQVDTETDGAAAVQRLGRQRYDLILCDFRMPGLGGAEIYRQVQQIDPQAARRFLFITGDTAGLATHEFFEQTGAPYLSKPFSMDQLTQRVRQMLQKDA